MQIKFSAADVQQLMCFADRDCHIFGLIISKICNVFDEVFLKSFALYEYWLFTATVEKQPSRPFYIAEHPNSLIVLKKKFVNHFIVSLPYNLHFCSS